MLWDPWLESLAGLPDDAPEWGALEVFLGQLKELAGRRLSVKRTELDEALKALELDCAEELKFFHASFNPAQWADASRLEEINEMRSLCQGLRNTLIEYRGVRNSPRSSIEEARRNREREGELESAALALIEKLQFLPRTDPHPAILTDIAISGPEVGAQQASSTQHVQEVSSENPASGTNVGTAKPTNPGAKQSSGQELKSPEFTRDLSRPTPRHNPRRARFLRGDTASNSIDDFLERRWGATGNIPTYLTDDVDGPLPSSVPGHPHPEAPKPVSLGTAAKDVQQLAASSIASTEDVTTEPLTAVEPELAQTESTLSSAEPDIPNATSTPAAAEQPESQSSQQAPIERLPNKQVDYAAWLSISARRPGLAYYLLTICKEFQPESQVLDPSLPAVIAYSPSVRSDNGVLVERLQSLWPSLQQWLETTTHPVRQPSRLLALAAAFVPTLLAPSTGAWDVVQSIRDFDQELPALGQIRIAVERYAALRVGADAPTLAGAQDYATWKGGMQELCDRVALWRQEQSAAKVIYAPTTNVWREWLKEDHELGAQLAAIITQRVPALETLEQVIATWTNERQVDRQLNRTDEQLRRGAAKRLPIEARAKGALRKKVEELISFLRQWLSLRRSEPSTLAPGRSSKIQELRDGVLSAITDAKGQLIHMGQHCRGDDPTRLAAFAAARQVELLGQLLGGQQRLFRPEPDPEWLLHRDLAFAPGLHIPCPLSTTMAAEVLQRLLDAAMIARSPQQAFDEQLQAGNHEASASLLSVFEDSGMDPKELEGYRQLSSESIDKHRHQLRSQAKQIEVAVQQAVCSGLLNETERQQALEVVEDTKAAAKETPNAVPFYTKLDQIRTQIAEHRARRLHEIEQRLNSPELATLRVEDRTLIDEVLTQGDFDTADELVELTIQGQSLSVERPALPNAFDRFLEFLPAMAAISEKGQEVLPAIIEAVSTGRSYGPVQITDYTLPQRTNSEQLLEAWRRLKARGSRGTHDERDLAALFEKLGFHEVVTKIIDRTPEQRWHAEFECQPITDQRTCMVPDFGSKACGRYAVLGVHGQPAIEDLARQARQATRDPERRKTERPLIVLLFGRLSIADRRRLAESMWGKRPLVLVDENLIAFLATERSGRLAALFQCTFPFASHQPYTTTATYVPVELFFGRKYEYEEVFRADGTCLVYGGRQLGKSVLLREVARREHDPERGIVAVWVDIKHRGVGIDKPPAHLWNVIGEILQREKVLDNLMSSPVSIRKRVKEWLNASPERRVLLLLDEADGFFDQDSRPTGESRNSFAVLAELKGLMDETDRRFKVVFAGLHNVQRTARDPNTPIFHLGTPVNIGPLLERGQWRHARELVEWPLWNMGYRFADPTLSMRILSHANFYPSLIQVFCKNLLQHLYSLGGQDFRSAPPYLITGDVIDRVYQSRESQKEIRDRFELTLNLDQRYRLLALLIARLTLMARESGELVNGFSVAEIREEAIGWWPEGFAADDTFEQFRILLEEMVGLGVLRTTPQGHSALRSVNVLNLLGDQARIEEMLCDVAAGAPSVPYEAASFRRTLTDSHLPERSPITAEQEGQLLRQSNSVSIIIGSRLAMVDGVQQAVELLSGQEVCVQRCASKESTLEFQQWLEHIDREKRDGLTLAIVPFACDWSAAWLTHAQEFLRPKRAATRKFLRVIFISDAEHLWRQSLRPFQSDEWELLQLRPWKESMVIRWLDDNGLNRDAAGGKVRQLMEATNGWGWLISRLGDNCRESQHQHLWEEQLQSLLDSWQSLEGKPLFDALQIPGEIASLLSFVATDAFDVSAVSEFFPNVPVARALEWAEAVAYVHRDAGDSFRVDPVIARILRTGVAP